MQFLATDFSGEENSLSKIGHTLCCNQEMLEGLQAQILLGIPNNNCLQESLTLKKKTQTSLFKNPPKSQIDKPKPLQLAIRIKCIM